MIEVAKKKRIFQIAKELNISHLEIMQYLVNNGTPADSHMAPVRPEVYDEILLEFSKDKLQIERHRKEQARKVVVSKIQQSQPEETKTEGITPKPPIRKLKTSLKDEKLALTDKLKAASTELLKDKGKAAPIDKKSSLKSNVDKPDIDASVKSSKKTDEKEKAKVAPVAPPERSDKIEIPPKPRKLKKISVLDIADKINQTKKRTVKRNDAQAKPQIKQPLPQFGKSVSKKKVKKKDKIKDEKMIL